MTHPFVSLPLWAFVAGALAVLGGLEGTQRFALAAITFPIAEYVVHRFLFHGPLSRTHAAHHRFPHDTRHFAVPVWIVASVAVPLYLALGPSATAGALTAFTIYDLVHLAAHGKLPLKIAFLARHHARHHEDETKCFAVTSPWIDTVMRSG